MSLLFIALIAVVIDVVAIAVYCYQVVIAVVIDVIATVVQSAWQ